MEFQLPDLVAPHSGVWSKIVVPTMPKTGRRWLEIGSLEGRSACWVLDNVIDDDGELVCVDPWRGVGVTRNERTFDYQTAGRATKVKSPSADFLREDTSTYHVIYVDGSHDAPDVLEDAVLAWPRLAVGGVMMFDDYRWHHPAGMAGKVSPGVAIDGFLAAYATRLTVLHKGFQVIVQKRR